VTGVQTCALPISQILELCDRVIWIDEGKIVMDGSAFEVVKAYEEVVNKAGAITMDYKVSPISPSLEAEVKTQRLKNISEPVKIDVGDKHQESCILWDDAFTAYWKDWHQPAGCDELIQGEFFSPKILAPGGISRWPGETGVKVIGFRYFGVGGEVEQAATFEPLTIQLIIKCEISGGIECRYGIAIDTYNGGNVCKLLSSIDKFEASIGNTRKIEVNLNPLLLGPGDYVVGVSIHSNTNIEQINSSVRYDIISRSFRLEVGVRDSLLPVKAEFYHPSTWRFA
jgi:lipopolysaccharide transport system ATP-binding protein